MPPEPHGLLCLGRRPTSVTIGFVIEDPEGAPVESCLAQVSGVMGYSAHQSCQFHRLPPGLDVADGGRSRQLRPWLCVVGGLQPETDYHVLLASANVSGVAKQASAAIQVSTSARPKPPSQLTVMVGPRALEAEWDLVDPVGAPAEDCGLEYSKDSVFASWHTAPAKPVAVMAGNAAHCASGEKLR